MLVRAAEMLWQEGYNFSLDLIGQRTGDLSIPLEKSVQYLQSKHRKINLLRNISDEKLAKAYDYADVSIFISKHEGYGLPVAESLSHGTPVIATNYGSISEIAEFGGCLLVNPRDIFSLTNAMKSILNSKELLDSLKEEAKASKFKNWDDYSKELAYVLSGGAFK
jgi:glycosyltransferase involved in cell wall biosynthesis